MRILVKGTGAVNGGVQEREDTTRDGVYWATAPDGAWSA